MASKQWGFFNVPHRVSIYNGHIQETMTLTTMPNVQQWSCHSLFKDLSVSRLGFQHPYACGANAQTDWAIAACPEIVVER